jgi:prevent-host-death family protein
MSRLPTRIPSSTLRDHFSEVTDEVSQGRRIIVTRNRKDRMALVPIADLERLRAMEDEDDLGAIRERADEPTTGWEKVKAELGL